MLRHVQLFVTPWIITHGVIISIYGILQVTILEWAAIPFSRGSSQARDQTQVSRIVGGFLPAEPQGKPKNTGVGSLSLLQRIFLTQDLNQGLLHCRQILYQLSYQGSPMWAAPKILKMNNLGPIYMWRKSLLLALARLGIGCVQQIWDV